MKGDCVGLQERERDKEEERKERWKRREKHNFFI